MTVHDGAKHRGLFDGQPLFTGQELVTLFGLITVGLAVAFLLGITWSSALPFAVISVGIGLLIVGVRHGSFAMTVVGGLISTAGGIFVVTLSWSAAVPLFVAALGIAVLMLIATERI